MTRRLVLAARADRLWARAALVLGVALVAAGSASPATGTSTAPVDYFNAEFEIQRVLEWGDRPVWSPDGTRLAFTESDTADSHAHELDLHTGEVRCLTCQWDDEGLVNRIYYLPDGSFLMTTPRLLPAVGPLGYPVSWVHATLSWMPAAADTHPQSLGAEAGGEVAITRTSATAAEGFAVAWGDPTSSQQPSGLSMANLVHDGTTARLDNRRIVYSPASDVTSGIVPGETYNLIDDDRQLTFFNFAPPSAPVEGQSYPVNGEMYVVDLESGAARLLYEAPYWNETHLFPDERFGLEEEVGTGLFVVAIDGSARRPLVEGANQSAPAPNGRRIAFAMADGLYVGEFR